MPRLLYFPNSGYLNSRLNRALDGQSLKHQSVIELCIRLREQLVQATSPVPTVAHRRATVKPQNISPRSISDLVRALASDALSRMSYLRPPDGENGTKEREGDKCRGSRGLAARRRQDCAAKARTAEGCLYAHGCLRVLAAAHSSLLALRASYDTAHTALRVVHCPRTLPASSLLCSEYIHASTGRPRWRAVALRRRHARASTAQTPTPLYTHTYDSASPVDRIARFPVPRQRACIARDGSPPWIAYTSTHPGMPLPCVHESPRTMPRANIDAHHHRAAAAIGLPAPPYAHPTRSAHLRAATRLAVSLRTTAPHAPRPPSRPCTTSAPQPWRAFSDPHMRTPRFGAATIAASLRAPYARSVQRRSHRGRNTLLAPRKLNTHPLAVPARTAFIRRCLPAPQVAPPRRIAGIPLESWSTLRVSAGGPERDE
ncbi:hypothetical protein C8R44DRAFT_732080 [Mycena epipterygia]|nr:hypothetical protein C8R44DRAFT_732080 [Mycena epipterygia]